MFLLSSVLFLLMLCGIDAGEYRFRFPGYGEPLFSVANTLRLDACRNPQLTNGRVRNRMKGRIARFSCDYPYELVGNRYAHCSRGSWDVDAPICVRPGCQVPVIENGVSIPTRQEAYLVFFCMPNYEMVGSSAIFCDGRRWNATAPKCIDSSGPMKMSCDFESPDICGWKQDDRHDFDWTRWNKNTPSSFQMTGPSFDHTYGQNRSGYFMYIESTSKDENDEARLISPIYSSNFSVNGCFSFYYHMFGEATGGLKVYQRPQRTSYFGFDYDRSQPLFSKWGNQGDSWNRALVPLKLVSDDFQIVIEGIRGSSFTSDIAIDDVAILQGDECASISERISLSASSCDGRCGSPASDPTDSAQQCGCDTSCLKGNFLCCVDYFDVCVFAGASATIDDMESTDYTLTTDVPSRQSVNISVATISTKPSPTTTSTKPFPPTTSTAKPSTSTKTSTKPLPTTTSTKPLPPTTSTAKPSTSTKTTSTTKKITTTPTTTAKTTTAIDKKTIITKDNATTVLIKNMTVTPSSTTLKATVTTTKLPQIISTIAYARKGRISKDELNNAKLSDNKNTSSKKTIFLTLGILICITGLVLGFIMIRRHTTLMTRGVATMWGRANNHNDVVYLTRSEDVE